MRRLVVVFAFGVALVACGRGAYEGFYGPKFFPATFRLARGEDTSLARLNALEDSLRRDSTSARAATWLWTLGRLTIHTHGSVSAILEGGTARDTGFVTAHRDQFTYSEPSGQFVYNGLHFQELIRRFPDDSLADDAAYALTGLGMVGECEGFVDCYIGTGVTPVVDFALAYRNSPLAPKAIARATEQLDFMMAFKPEPGDIWTVDSTEMHRQLTHLDSVATALPDALRAPLYASLAPYWQRRRNATRAKEMREWLQAHPKR